MKKLYILNFVAIILLLFSCDTIPYEEQISQYNTLYEEAIDLKQQENYKGAIVKLNDAIEITDTLSSALLLRGICQYEISEFSKSIDDFSDAIDLEGDTSIGYKYRSICYLAMNEYSDFKDDIDDYLDNNKNDADAFVLRTNYYINFNDFDDALDDCMSAIKLTPTNPDLFLLRGEIYSSLGENVKSITDYDKYLATTTNPDIGKVYFQKGSSYFKIGKYQKAIEAFLMLTNKDNSNYAEMQALRGKAYYEIGDSENAIIDYSYILSSDKNNYDILHGRADAYLKIEDVHKAKLDYNKAAIIEWDSSSFFYKYSFIISVFLIFGIISFIIFALTEEIIDDNNLNRIIKYLIFSSFFGGHYLALRNYKKYWFFAIIFFTLLILNNYNIVSFYSNSLMFLENLYNSSISLILLASIIILLIFDLFTIKNQTNKSNYNYCKTIDPETVINRGIILNSIEENIDSINSQFDNIKYKRDELF